MPILPLDVIEKELKKRWKYPYNWGVKQNDVLDRKTNFIYQIAYFEELEKYCQAMPEAERNYAFNRWYNYWSACAMERIFALMPQVTPAPNEKDRLKDFFLCGISFDHKTTIFPAHFPHTLFVAQKNPLLLITWLYRNQSQQQRWHYKNRLFVVLYNSNGAHWKLKAEISWLKIQVMQYLMRFDTKQLYHIQHSSENYAYADVIWCVR
jgi:hypothetical protein